MIYFKSNFNKFYINKIECGGTQVLARIGKGKEICAIAKAGWGWGVGNLPYTCLVAIPIDACVRVVMWWVRSGWSTWGG